MAYSFHFYPVPSSRLEWVCEAVMCEWHLFIVSTKTTQIVNGANLLVEFIPPLLFLLILFH